MPHVWNRLMQKLGVEEEVILPPPPEIGQGWVPIQKGHTIPKNAVIAGTTKSDGVVYVARFNGEAGKINVDEGKMWNFWGNNNGRSQIADIYCTSEKYHWTPISRSDKIPPGAVKAGEIEKDGIVYVGRSSGEAGKINVEHNAETKVDTMYNFWGHSTKRQEMAEILVMLEEAEVFHSPRADSTAATSLHASGVAAPSLALERVVSMSKAQKLQQQLGFVTEEQAEAALQEVAGDEDLAIEVILRKAPSLKDKPKEWFEYFDGDKNGSIDVDELSNAIAATLKVSEPEDYVKAMVRDWFQTYDVDDSGTWDLNEFLTAREAILAALGVYDTDDDAVDKDEMHYQNALKAAADEREMQHAMTQLSDACQRLQPSGVLAVYFCASLELPQGSFTPVLIERCHAYEANKIPIEVMVVPMDSSHPSFFASQAEWGDQSSWHVVGKESWEAERGMRMKIATLLDVRSVPSVVLLDRKAKVRARNGVEILTADTTGEHFDSWSEDLPELHVAPNAVGARNLRKLQQELAGFKVDEGALAEQASKAPLTVDGYNTVAEMKSNIAMRAFMTNVASTKGWVIQDQRKLGDLVWEHSGVRQTQSLSKLIEDLMQAEWVSKPSESGEPALPARTVSAVMKPSGSGKAGDTDEAHATATPMPEGNEAAVTPAPDPLAAQPKPKSKGKGTPPPPPAGAAVAGAGAGTVDGDGAADAATTAPPSAGKSKGKGAPPSKGKGKGGPPPAPGGKKGGKGAILDARNQPTREEKEDWIKRKKPKLHWKRYLAQQHGEIKDSVFRENIEGEIPMEEFTNSFELVDNAKAEEEKTKKVEKPPLWSGTDKLSPAERRKQLSILAVGSFKTGSVELIDRLAHMRFEAIISDANFSEDNLERLAETMSTFTPDDTTKLKDEAASKAVYTWDERVEGFFSPLIAVPKVSERLNFIRGHRDCMRLSGEVLFELERIEKGMRAVLESDALMHLLHKVLTIGNCLDAGDAKLGRADAFNVVPIFKDTILSDMPKGNHDMSVLKFLRTEALTDEDRLKFKELHSQLDGWSMPKPDGEDSGDLGFYTNQSGVLTRKLVKLEKSLQEERKSMAKEEQGIFIEKCLEEHRTASSDIDARIATLKEELEALQKYFIYTPPVPPGGTEKDRNFLAAGPILGVIGELARRLKEEEQHGRRRSARNSVHARLSLASTPEKDGERRRPSKRGMNPLAKAAAEKAKGVAEKAQDA